MGIKERRTKILLSLFLLSDVNLDYVKFNENNLSYFDLTLNPKTRSTLSNLIKSELIENKEDGQYRLTESGFQELCLNFPYFRFLKYNWDNKWRILSYEIPENKRELRDKLRREVSGWGLGPWHRSFWLTPHPVIENLKGLVSGQEEEKYVQAFESEHVFGDREVLIEKVWKKSLQERRYRELFKKWHEILSQELSNVEKFKKVIIEYIKLLRVDPGLPKELVGQDWIGFEAYNIFKEIRSILLQ